MKTLPRPPIFTESWSVPEYNKARPAMKRLAEVELSVDFEVQVIPATMGDLPIARLVAAAPKMYALLKEAVNEDFADGDALEQKFLEIIAEIET